MNLTVKGSERSVEVDMHEYEAHKEAIEHWVNGGDVEYGTDKLHWATISEPNFSLAFKYRPKKRRPKEGEVWATRCGDNILIINNSKASDFLWFEENENYTGLDYVYSNVNDYFDEEGEGVFLADSLEQYYAKKFLEESKRYDLVSLLDVIKSKL